MYNTGPFPSSPFAPLYARFGDRLALRRDGKRASWSLDDRIAVVESRGDGSLVATFTDRATSDGCGMGRVSAIYHTCGTYALGLTGCARMVDDLVAFFNGVREPRFAFAGIEDSMTCSRRFAIA